MKSIRLEDTENHVYKPHVLLTLRLRLILLIGLLILGIFSIMGILLHTFFANTLETQLGERALGVATSVAHIPELRTAFELDDPSVVIQPLVEQIREETGAEFIVVGNINEIRYSHPIHQKVGKKMVGEDNTPALLRGESYISKAEGSLGYSIRGKVPIRSIKGEVIGVVSVGYLMNDVQSLIHNYVRKIWYVLFILIGLGIVGAIFIADYIKKVLFGLEPEVISHLLLQKETILQSTHEGIIAVNHMGYITLINTAAKNLIFNRPIQNEHLIGKAIWDILPNSIFSEILQKGESQFDIEVSLGEHTILVNRVPIYHKTTLVGEVSTFRNKTEIDRLTKELTRIKQYADALRAQTHEFSNKLFTILGLIELERKEDAVAFIKRENNIQQGWIHFLMENVPDSMVNAILLGKLNQAMEKRVQMNILSDSRLTQPLSDQTRNALVTVLGNLLDNAIDATKMKPDSERIVTIFFTDLGDDIVFEIEDSGHGVPDELMNEIFNPGYSTKVGSHRGIGLALTKQALLNIGGNIYLEEGALPGACFVITIPKNKIFEEG